MILIYFNNYFLFKAWKNKKILRVLIITQLESKTTFTDLLGQLSPDGCRAKSVELERVDIARASSYKKKEMPPEPSPTKKEKPKEG